MRAFAGPRSQATLDAIEAALGELVRAGAVTFERAVLDLGPPPLTERDDEIVVHAHCHARALGGGADAAAVLALIPGLTVRDSGAGCCGMAGGFGYRHPGLSRTIAGDRLVPAVSEASATVAAGTSCRHQIDELAGVRSQHPAEILASALARPGLGH